MAFDSVTILTFLSTITGVSAKSALVRSFWDLCKPSYAATKKYPAVPDIITCDNVGSPRRLDYDGRASCGGEYPYRGDLALAPLTTKQVSEGFAQVKLATEDRDTNAQCCKCYKLTLTSGPAKGSALVVQVVDINRQHQFTDPTFALAIPGLTGYDNNCSSQYGKDTEDNHHGLQLGDGCRWQDDWLGSPNATVAYYKETGCPATLQGWSDCGRDWAHNPIDGTDDSTSSTHLGKELKVAIGVSCIPLFISISALSIYCIKRRPTPPPVDLKPLLPKKTWKEQIRWDKPELNALGIQEMGNKSIRELDTTCIHEIGSIRTKISTTWREALIRTWSLRSITQRSLDSPRAPKNSVRDV